MKKKHRRMGFMLVLGREQEMKVLRCTECTRGVLIHKSTRCILSGEKLHREGIPSPSKAVLGAWVETARQRDLGYSYAQIAPGQPGTTEQLSQEVSSCLIAPCLHLIFTISKIPLILLFFHHKEQAPLFIAVTGRMGGMEREVGRRRCPVLKGWLRALTI